jgi:hypothetical protein
MLHRYSLSPITGAGQPVVLPGFPSIQARLPRPRSPAFPHMQTSQPGRTTAE